MTAPRLRLTALPLVALLLFPATAFAETQEEREAVVEEFVELYLQRGEVAVVIERLYQPILDQAAEDGTVPTEAQVAQVRQLYLETFTASFEKQVRDRVRHLADVLTLNEVTAMRDCYATPECRLEDFNATPEGRSAMAKMAKQPPVEVAQDPEFDALLKSYPTTLVPTAMAILNGEAPPALTTQP